MTWPEAFAIVGGVTGGGFAFAFLMKWVGDAANREQKLKSDYVRMLVDREMEKARGAPTATGSRWEYRSEPVKPNTVREKGKK